MKPDKIVNSIEVTIHRTTRAAMYISTFSLFIMMLLTTVDVIGRYAFNHPVKGTVEISELMMVLFVFPALAYCTLYKGHIIMESVLVRLSKRVQAYLNCITSLICAGVAFILSWQIGLRALRELFAVSGKVTDVLHITIAPFLILATIGLAMLCLEFVISVFHSFTEAKTGLASHEGEKSIDLADSGQVTM